MLNSAMKIFAKCVVSLLVILQNYQIQAQTENLIVKTKNGEIRGTKNTTVAKGKVYHAFRGIPFAEPPIGDLRFSAPVPVKNWSGVRNATRDGNICAQAINEGSEDCLFINVYTTNLNHSKLLPVMVWIYGGYYLTGSSRYSEYGPDYFLDEDVIVVSFNYRLGVFGFLSTQDKSAAGNWGLKDQILALHWVQDNIENFGGDPKRVTIFGESAGSGSVSYLVQTPVTKGLFHAAIMESGMSLDIWSLSRQPRRTAFNVGLKLGIITTDPAVLVERLRKVQYKTLLQVATVSDLLETVFTNPANGLIFAPSEEPNDKNAVVVHKSHEKLKHGDFNRVPMIVGFNSQEAQFFQNLLNVLRLYLLTYDILPVRLIPIDMNVKPSNELTVALEIKRHYFGENLLVLKNDEVVQYITDSQFVKGINEAALLMSKYTSVYYYRFSYEGRLGLDKNQTRPGVGVGHAEELNYLWRRADTTKPSEPDLLTRHRLIKMWTNFAKTLNPTPTRDPLLQNVTWTHVDQHTRNYLDIGKDLVMHTNLSQYSIEWWQKLYNEYGHPPYDTY